MIASLRAIQAARNRVKKHRYLLNGKGLDIDAVAFGLLLPIEWVAICQLLLMKPFQIGVQVKKVELSSPIADRLSVAGRISIPATQWFQMPIFNMEQKAFNLRAPAVGELGPSEKPEELFDGLALPLYGALGLAFIFGIAFGIAQPLVYVCL